MKTPAVSIACVTYNHIEYIDKAVNGFLMQRCDFDYEIIIGDDNSTDGTKEILEKYKNEFPEKIKIITSDRNSGSLENNIKVISSCAGEFIAFCDGDDYWTDPFKLQKQVDFLKDNHDFIMTYADISFVDHKNQEIQNERKTNHQKVIYKSGEIFWDLFKNSFINTNTACVRSEIVFQLLNYVKNHKKNRHYIYDYWLWLNVARRGKVKFMNEKMAAYRIHGRRISNKSYFDKRWPAVKLDIALSLNEKEVTKKENRNFVTGILLSSLLNKKVEIKLKGKAIIHLFSYPPSVSYLFQKVTKKNKWEFVF